MLIHRLGNSLHALILLFLVVEQRKAFFDYSGNQKQNSIYIYIYIVIYEGYKHWSSDDWVFELLSGTGDMCSATMSLYKVPLEIVQKPSNINYSSTSVYALHSLCYLFMFPEESKIIPVYFFLFGYFCFFLVRKGNYIDS